MLNLKKIKSLTAYLKSKNDYQIIIKRNVKILLAEKNENY